MAERKNKDPVIGKTLGNYKILREWGRGGMGVVYRGEQVSMKRDGLYGCLQYHVTICVNASCMYFCSIDNSCILLISYTVHLVLSNTMFCIVLLVEGSLLCLLAKWIFWE